jgi:hypothetical protein
VTLVADFFARPGLEARKERILERHRAKREFSGLLGLILVAATAMIPDPPAQMTGSEVEIYRSEQGAQRERILAASLELQDRAVGFLMIESPRVRKVTAKGLGWVRGVAISAKANNLAGAEILVIASPLADLLSTPRWRVIRRIRRLASAESLINSQ